MKRVLVVVVFAVLIVAIVAAVVFTSGNNPQPATTVNQNKTQAQATTNLTILPSVNASVITLAQLAQHKNKSGCWVGYNNSVYDITEWLPRHPGSSGAIEPYCGTAAEFEAAFTGKHGTSQVKRLIAEGKYQGSLQ